MDKTNASAINAKFTVIPRRPLPAAWTIDFAHVYTHTLARSISKPQHQQIAIEWDQLWSSAKRISQPQKHWGQGIKTHTHIKELALSSYIYIKIERWQLQYNWCCDNAFVNETLTEFSMCSSNFQFLHSCRAYQLPSDTVGERFPASGLQTGPWSIGSELCRNHISQKIF